MSKYFAAVVVLATACSAGKEPARQEPASAVPVVSLEMKQQTFQAPDTIDAGLTTFRFVNHGDEIHYAHAVKLDSARSVAEFLAAYTEAVRSAGPRPTYIKRSGGPGGTAPGDSSTVTHLIEPGHYVWICPVDDSTGTPHFHMGEARTFVVRPAGPNSVAASPPRATSTVHLVNYGFRVDEPLKSGKHTFRVVNEGPDGHDLVMAKLDAGKTMSDVKSWLRELNGPPPFSLVGGVAVLAPKMEAYFDRDITPGNYVLLCMTTAQNGRTHIELGMVHEIRVE